MISSAIAMSNHPRRVMAPGVSPRKRKERDGFDALKPSFTAAAAAAAPTAKRTSKAADVPTSNNRLVAGYLAHEFLTRGTLLGQVWDPARAEASAAESNRFSSSSSLSSPSPNERGLAPPSSLAKSERYGELASLLKADGAHMPGIVNPTQLARLLNM